MALRELRFMLQQIGVPMAQAYRTQDLRRGHTLDLQAAGIECVKFCDAHVLVRCLPRCTSAKDFAYGRMEDSAVHGVHGR